MQKGFKSDLSLHVSSCRDVFPGWLRDTIIWGYQAMVLQKQLKVIGNYSAMIII